MTSQYEVPVVNGGPRFGPRLLLVAVQRDLYPPVHYGSNFLQRMRVTFVEPGTPRFSPELALMLPALQAPWPALPRPVHGEILRDEGGQLYEKQGCMVRRLGAVVSGPHGEILEVPFPSEERLALPPPRAAERMPALEVEAASRPRRPPAWRALFPEPGQWRVLVWGESKHALGPQLAHPERLRDSHRLPCYVQVYETRAVQDPARLAAALLGDPGRAGEFHPLTEVAAAKLELAALLSPAPPEGARFFRLQVAHDPTIDQTSPASPAREANPAAAAHRTTIPERYLKPWEFRYSREEVLYDMNAEARPGALGSLARWFKQRFGSREEIKKWQALLEGKSAEEQLWGVRPPKGILTHPQVRQWAAQLLTAASYDSQTMLAEWEIFWRRKSQ